ncbi:Ankyrin repeat [Sesbania bispinosa]|nr:Ankyrin repeat [Sesbania bispinosa]
MAMANSTPFQQQFQRAASAQFRRPLLHLVSTQEANHRYLTQCIPLHKSAQKGDWTEARKILVQDWTLLISAITKGWATVLHIAVEANHVHFVEELVKLLQHDDLELQDFKGNTAFCFAAALGNVQIAEIMRRKNESLPTIRGGEGMTPLHLAILQGRSEMAGYLFPKSKEILEEVDWITLFLTCINSGLYDLALEMLNQKDTLAYARGDDNETGMKDTSILNLIKRMWDIILFLDDTTMMETITEPSQVIFIAAEVGNFEFLSVILSTYPDLIWELDTMGQSIIHIAVLYRHASIFNLIQEIGPVKDFIITFMDDEENNLLHCAAKLAPPNQLNLVSGAALQMMLELSWFEEVKKIMPPLIIEMKNLEGMTPCQLFTMEHEELLKKGESWMKRTTKSCMFVSTLIATGVCHSIDLIFNLNPNFLVYPYLSICRGRLSQVTAIEVDIWIDDSVYLNNKHDGSI